MVTSCKPCFVPQYCKRYFISYFGGNHLSTKTNVFVLLLVHFQGRKRPYLNLGFSLVGFTRSTSFISERATSLWHFYRYSCHIRWGLRHFPGRQQNPLLPWLIFSPGTNTTNISVCASMDFPLQLVSCSNYPNVITLLKL
jgi:hypothetical protein